jgi:hypothetical protein
LPPGAKTSNWGRPGWDSGVLCAFGTTRDEKAFIYSFLEFQAGSWHNTVERWLMYMRLAFWTVALAYTSVLLSRTTNGFSPGTMLAAAVLGAVMGFCLGGMFANRRTRKRC